MNREEELTDILRKVEWGQMDSAVAFDRILRLFSVSNRFPETTDKHEPIIIEMYKEHLVELYNFAYKQALKTGKVDELKEIDRKINGC